MRRTETEMAALAAETSQVLRASHRILRAYMESTVAESHQLVEASQRARFDRDKQRAANAERRR